MKKAEYKSYSRKAEEDFYRTYKKAKKERGKAMAKKAKYVPYGWMVEYRDRSCATKRWLSWEPRMYSETKAEAEKEIERYQGDPNRQTRLVRVYRRVEK